MTCWNSSLQAFTANSSRLRTDVEFQSMMILDEVKRIRMKLDENMPKRKKTSRFTVSLLWALAALFFFVLGWWALFDTSHSTTYYVT